MWTWGEEVKLLILSRGHVMQQCFEQFLVNKTDNTSKGPRVWKGTAIYIVWIGELVSEGMLHAIATGGIEG